MRSKATIGRAGGFQTLKRDLMNPNFRGCLRSEAAERMHLRFESNRGAKNRDIAMRICKLVVMRRAVL